MGRPQTKKKQTGCNRIHHTTLKLKHYARDIDQIHTDLLPSNQEKLTHQVVDEDLPGAGQHYCVACARYFIDEKALDAHVKSKAHKKRIRELKTVPYSQEEAERCAGLGTDTRKQPMQTD